MDNHTGRFVFTLEACPKLLWASLESLNECEAVLVSLALAREALNAAALLVVSNSFEASVAGVRELARALLGTLSCTVSFTLVGAETLLNEST